MSAWYVACSTCQEPVGKPVWAHGCACEDELTGWQEKLLAVINEAWNNIEWEEAGYDNWGPDIGGEG